VTRIFGAIGRLSVRFRYPVVLIWLAVTVLSVHLFPSLASVSKDTNGGFLPADTASTRAAELAAPFLDSNHASAILVANTRSGALGASDQAAILRLEQGIPTLASDVTVRDLGVSPDGAVRQALIQTRLAPYDGSGEGSRLVDRIRAELSAASASGNVAYHLTGELPTVVDVQKGASSSRSSTQGVSMLLIVVLLLVAFRALLAPLLTLAPAVMVLLLASPVIAAATRIGVQVSSITQVVLVVLLLGAGTDYGLFLVFRVREELRRGLAPKDAVVRAVSTVGESITFSALTVIAALMSLVLARFGLYQSLGPALAIGIALMLLAGLTLLPAILAIFGRAVFWPSRTRLVENPKTGLYGRIAGGVTRRPLAVAAAGVLGLAALAAGSLSAPTAGFADRSTGPAGSDSAAGSAVLAAHLPSPPNPTDVVLRFSQPVWSSLVAVDEAEQQLRASGRVGRVTGPLDLGLSAAQIVRIHALTGRDPQQLLATGAPPAGVSAADYNRYRTLGQYIAGGGRTVKLSAATLRGDTSSPSALAEVPGLRDTATAIARRVGAVDSGVFSLPAFAYDVSHLAHDDLAKVIPIVAVLIALLLALVLRSLVAPLYLVVSVLLSYLAALGAVAIVFVHIGGSQGINFVLPFLMFVFLMALGSDYNILVMTRIREEAQHLPLAEAVRRAVGATGTTVTTAGVILGGTFAVLAVAAGNAAGADQIRQIGYGIAAGVLMDTFLIRTVLVPAVVTLLGRWNWWPSPLFRRSAGVDAVTTETAAPAGDRPAAA
jgi:RND superfamily putative drug exporter